MKSSKFGPGPGKSSSLSWPYSKKLPEVETFWGDTELSSYTYLYMSKQLNCVTGKWLTVGAKVTTNFQIKDVEKRNQKT